MKTFQRIYFIHATYKIRKIMNSIRVLQNYWKPIIFFFSEHIRKYRIEYEFRISNKKELISIVRTDSYWLQSKPLNKIYSYRLIALKEWSSFRQLCLLLSSSFFYWEYTKTIPSPEWRHSWSSTHMFVYRRINISVQIACVLTLSRQNNCISSELRRE